MANPNLSPEVVSIFNLLREYSFDLDHYAGEVLINQWIQTFGYRWVSTAVTEALYQGRYKIISVDHILHLWQRRGQPIRHFSREFESIILGQTLLAVSPYEETAADARDNCAAEIIPLAASSLRQQQPSARQGSIPDFRPALQNLTPAGVSPREVIPPFVPLMQPSGLHQRLSSVVQAVLET